MNRHHPYDNSGQNRRGGSGGPGPDRYNRYQDRGGGGGPRGRGGGARGRGGYSGYDSNNNAGNYGGYNQGPPDGEMSGGYNNYEGPPQEVYYQQNQPYNPPGPRYSPGPAGGFNQGYSKSYEDGPSSSYDEGPGRGGSQRRPVRKDRDDKVHDSIIEERIQRERPCRILFIRNIKYETNSADVRRQFEEFGTIKTFFDLISTRGMVFVTYYDLRSAERARERMQGSEISGRPIDVHYSLPRDNHSKGNEEKSNGTLQVTLMNSMSGQPIDDAEVRRKFQTFGDIKSVRPVNDRMDSRYVEFFDTRACDEAFERMKNQGLQDGTMEIVLAWDNPETSGSGQRDSQWEDHSKGGSNRGNRGRGNRGGRGRGGPPMQDDFDRRGGGPGGPGGDFGRDRGGRGRFDDDYGRGGGRGGFSGGPGGFPDRFDQPNRGNYNNGVGGGYNPGPPPPNYGPPPPMAAALPTDDRLEQARKVQQLLAALKQPSQSEPIPAPQLPPPPGPGMMPMPPAPPGYYPPMGQPPYQPDSSNAYGGPPSALPPNIMAMVQAAQHNQGSTPPPIPSFGAPPPQNGNYQNFMSYLANKPS
ncbi:hypothetical protein C8J56DRAFT_919800 [Mycena floridula]|nr:hypothetical protein C8J56DRAFT_919800 [Mycena floridula]